MVAKSNKKDSVKINVVNGFTIYLDPENGRFFFTLKNDNHERVEFETLREAEATAVGDREPVKVINVGHNFYQYPEVVEVIGFSNWNLVTKDWKRLSPWRVFAYDEALLDRLINAAEACAKAHERWTYAVEDLQREAGRIIDDWQETNIKTVDGEHERAKNGLLKFR